MRVLLTGGGTGGHVYPALAIAERLRAEDASLEVLFVGTRHGLEAGIVPKSGVRMEFVAAAPLLRKLSFALVRTLGANIAGFVQSLAVLHRFRPDVAIATGGYVTLPVIAALRFVRLLRRSRARIALVEPNAVAGLTNRLLAPLVDEVWLGIAPADGRLRPRESVTGTPVRASMRVPLDAGVARASLGLDPARRTVLVLGGSQGARSINDAIVALASDSEFPDDVQVLVIAGERDLAGVRARLAASANPRFHAVGYLDDPRAAYAAASLAVARAGASTLGELEATATAAVLIPYPHATDDHQRANATAYAAAGGAVVLDDRDLSPASLREAIVATLARESDLRRVVAERGARDPLQAIAARVKAWSPSNVLVP